MSSTRTSRQSLIGTSRYRIVGKEIVALQIDEADVNVHARSGPIVYAALAMKAISRSRARAAALTARFLAHAIDRSRHKHRFKLWADLETGLAPTL